MLNKNVINKLDDSSIYKIEWTLCNNVHVGQLDHLTECRACMEYDFYMLAVVFLSKWELNKGTGRIIISGEDSWGEGK